MIHVEEIEESHKWVGAETIGQVTRGGSWR